MIKDIELQFSDKYGFVHRIALLDIIIISDNPSGIIAVETIASGLDSQQVKIPIVIESM